MVEEVRDLYRKWLVNKMFLMAGKVWNVLLVINNCFRGFSFFPLDLVEVVPDRPASPLALSNMEHIVFFFLYVVTCISL